MLYIPNCPQWIIANFAINKIGAVVVPVSPIYTAYEIEYMIKDAEIETVICLDTNFVYVKEVMAQDKPETGHRDELVDLLPRLEKGDRPPLRQDPRGQGRSGAGKSSLSRRS